MILKKSRLLEKIKKFGKISEMWVLGQFCGTRTDSLIRKEKKACGDLVKSQRPPGTPAVSCEVGEWLALHTSIHFLVFCS